jgi:hypothetical protein
MRASSSSLAFLILATLAACVHATAPVAPPPTPPANLPAPVPEAPSLEPLTVCVVRNGVLGEVPVSYDPATGDSLYEGRRFRDAFPTDSTFAASAAWYHAYEPIMMFRRRYVSYGLPRAMPPGSVVARGEYRGLTVYVDSGASTTPPVLYLPVRPTCEFQPYDTEAGRGVRGGQAAGNPTRGRESRAEPPVNAIVP